MNWFGDDWDAPALRVLTRVKTPVGHYCLRCKQPIKPGDQGFETGQRTWVWHRDCFVKCVTGSKE